MKYGGKVMKKNQNRRITRGVFFWVLISSVFITWIPFPFSLIPIISTLLPLVISPVIAKKYKDSTMEKKGKGKLEPDFVDRYLNEGFSGGGRKRGVPDLEGILKKHSRNDESNQEEEIINYRTESIIKDDNTPSKKQKSIINYGSKKKKFISRY